MSQAGKGSPVQPEALLEGKHQRERRKGLTEGQLAVPPCPAVPHSAAGRRAQVSNPTQRCKESGQPATTPHQPHKDMLFQTISTIAQAQGIMTQLAACLKPLPHMDWGSTDAYDCSFAVLTAYHMQQRQCCICNAGQLKACPRSARLTAKTSCTATFSSPCFQRVTSGEQPASS